MAKAKSKSKKKNQLIGHNSASAEDDEEMRRIAKAQRSLDNEKSAKKAEWKERDEKLLARLGGIGQTRKSFKEPYALFCRLADAENDDDAKQKQNDNVVFLAAQRRAYDALTPGKQTDWISLIQDAAQIENLREQEERAAAEAAAEAVDDPEETEADV